MTLWFSQYHYALWVKPNTIFGVEYVQLFEHLKDAQKAAKFALYNSERVSLLSIQDSNFTGKELYTTKTNKRLKKVKS